MDFIVKIVYGSHLYGTNTPSSDKDFKGAFFPTLRELLLNRIPKSLTDSIGSKMENGRNSKDAIDSSYYSLHYFIKLACEGDTVALDMLHTPKSLTLLSSPTWEDIVSRRHLFYSKNLKSFMGYARHQAAKYGLKGDRLQVVVDILSFLKEYPDDSRLESIKDWASLPSVSLITLKQKDIPLPAIEFLGKKFSLSTKVVEIRRSLTNYLTSYGDRSTLAQQNNGIDWKALSHAFRAAFQLKEICETGDLIYPLRDAPFLVDIKLGRLDYNSVALSLDSLIEEVRSLFHKSTFPEKVDVNYWDDFVVSVLEDHFFS